MKKYLLIAVTAFLLHGNAYAFDILKCKALLDLTASAKEKHEQNKDAFYTRAKQRKIAIRQELAPKYCSKVYSTDSELHSKCTLALTYVEPSYLPKGAFKKVVEPGFYEEPSYNKLQDKLDYELYGLIYRHRASMEKIKNAESKEGCP